MGRIADAFERLTERFLGGDLDRRTRFLSWVTLIFLMVCVWGVWTLSNYRVSVKEEGTGRKIEIPVKSLLLDQAR